MKTKKYLFMVALLTMASLGLRAQEYVPIVQEGNEWNTLSVVTPGLYIESYTNYFNWCSGDTIIDGVRYTKIMGTTDGDNPRLFTLLREEEGKVWNKELNIQTEVLLYDFSANVGDTLRIGNFDEELVLDSISIEQIGGVDRKKFWFGLEYDFLGEPYAVETWIEGIGSSFGLLCSGYWGITGGYICALCFHQNGELIWQNPEYNACIITAIEEVEMQKTCVYPNPTSVSFTIEGSVKTLAVYNSFGQEVYSGTARTVDVRGWPAGVYFVRVMGKDGRVATMRIVVE